MASDGLSSRISPGPTKTEIVNMVRQSDNKVSYLWRSLVFLEMIVPLAFLAHCCSLDGPYVQAGLYMYSKRQFNLVKAKLR